MRIPLACCLLLSCVADVDLSLFFFFLLFLPFFDFDLDIVCFHPVFFLWVLCCLLGFGFCCDSFSIWYVSWLAKFHADLFSRHTSPLEVYVFVAVANRGEDMSNEILSSIQWKTAIKEAEWPKCAAPRLVYDSPLFFETCMHVYVHTRSTTYDQIYSAKIKSIPRR